MEKETYHPPGVYVVMINDRHTDPQAYLFSTLDKAIVFAETYVSQHEPIEEEYEPTMSSAQLVAAGWLWYRKYSYEDDAIWIYRTQIDKEAS